MPGSPIYRRWHRAAGERGSAAVELAILLPAVLALVALLVTAARIALAGDRISGVASAAARAASVARTGTAATAAASAAAAQALEEQHAPCTGHTVTVDTSGFAAPVGAPAVVRVTVTCTVDLSVIGLPGLPGRRTLTDSAVSPLDLLRAP